MKRLWGLLLLPLLMGASPAVQKEIDRGQEAWEGNDLANALVHWSLGLKAARDEGDPAAEFELLLRLAAAHREAGNLGTAGDAVAAARELAASDADTGRAQQAEGQIALAAGDARAAEKLFQASFRTLRDAQDPAGAANAAVNLGRARLATGDIDGARKALGAAAKLFDTLGDRSGRADALTNLGVALRRSGALPDARNTLEQALELYRAAGDVSGEADALTNLGLVLQDLGRDDLARELYEAALSSARRRKDVKRQAALLANLGTLAHAAGDLREADQHYRAAEKAFVSADMPGAAAGVALNRAQVTASPEAAYQEVMRRASEAGDARIQAMAALNLASLLIESDPGAASKHLDTAEQHAARLQLAEVRWRAAYLRGKLALSRGKDKEATKQLRQAVDVLERTRKRLDDDESRAFVLDYADVYETLIDTLLAQGDSAGAFLYAQRLQMAQLPQAVPDDEKTLKYRQLAAEEERLVAQLSAELDTQPDSERAKALQQQLDTLRVEFASTVDELRATHAEFDQLVRVDPEDLESVQRDLDPGVVVLQPVVLSDKLVLLVFRREHLKAYTVDVSGHDVAKAASRMARLLQADMAMDRSLIDGMASKLGGWLLDPIAGELATAEVVVVSATGPLQQIPFAMLRHQDRYLVQDAAVVGVTHVGSLRKRDATEVRYQLAAKELLLVGNPDGSLPGAEAEVEQIAEQFAGATTLIGPQGTRDALFTAADGKTTLHLATHGRIDPVVPTRSHLVLAGNGGRLSYREIPGLASHLSQARLVVLSACESGRPVVANPNQDSEELVISIGGIANQFRRAGVETMVASLWKVSDAGTLNLMRGLYDELAEGHDIGRSLANSQRRMIADPELGHPWYWGAFVVMGDWR